MEKGQDRAPEILSRLAQEFFDYSEEGDNNFLNEVLRSQGLSHKQGPNTSPKNDLKLSLSKVEFLFGIARTKEEVNEAVKAARAWARVQMESSRDRESAAFEIGNTLNSLAITSSLLNLPKECSAKLGFPLTLSPSVTPQKLPNRIRVSSAGRIDIAGGWTDTPPITYELGNPHVVNAAIKVDGQKPIRADIHPLDSLTGLWISTGEGTLRCFETAEEVYENAQKPSESCSLICAVVVASGILETSRTGIKDLETVCLKPSLLRFEIGRFSFRGLFIECHSSLPHGSGLGTSSILSGAVLAGLWTLFCKKFTERDIIKAVLKIEQYHTTGGGWQDQVGGLVPGIKLCSLSPPPAQSVTYRVLSLPEHFQASLNERLCLIYTGKTRLAKNLLQRVLLNWIRGDLEILLAFRTLASEAEQAAKQLAAGIFPIGIAENYHEIKKKLAVGSEPVFVGDLIKDLKKSGLIEAAWIAGAGGGGFLYVYLKENMSYDSLKTHIEGHKEYQSLKVSTVEIDDNPLEIQIA